MDTCVHFSRSLPSNSWWQTVVGWQVLSRPSAAESGGRRPAFTGFAAQPYSATEVDGWQHKLSRVPENRAAVHFKSFDDIVDHCCFVWNMLIDQPWKIMSIARPDWAGDGQSL
jgi:hypothetical protein